MRGKSSRVPTAFGGRDAGEDGAATGARAIGSNTAPPLARRHEKKPSVALLQFSVHTRTATHVSRPHASSLPTDPWYSPPGECPRTVTFVELRTACAVLARFFFFVFASAGPSPSTIASRDAGHRSQRVARHTIAFGARNGRGKRVV